LEEKVESSVYKTEITAAGIRRADHATPLYPQDMVLTSLTSGGRSVGIVRLLTKASDFYYYRTGKNLEGVARGLTRGAILVYA
jgi:hypothetical protein